MKKVYEPLSMVMDSGYAVLLGTLSEKKRMTHFPGWSHLSKRNAITRTRAEMNNES